MPKLNKKSKRSPYPKKLSKFEGSPESLVMYRSNSIEERIGEESENRKKEPVSHSFDKKL